ncbi:MAG: tetraacyldisaccharide 4'-kinase [Terracidiphilus sp.]|nr:tetraacyldisaccharide 4'-kinase [Terracidiphilus sp.]
MNRSWLAPLTPLYAAGLALRALRLGTRLEPVRRLRWPVVSVGNLSTGGAGKTPLTIALAKALTQRGMRVDVLSRGYGRRDKSPARVDPDGAAEEFGDEPLLIAQEAEVPVYVAAQRYQAGLLAEADSSELGVHMLDDGFQHRQLHRDVNILLLNRQDWTDSLLPAGNLREPLQAARRATVLAIPASEPGLEAELKAWGWTGPVWRLRRTMEVPKLDGPATAFCGIARSAQFFAGLEEGGVHIAARIAFRDHHRYTPTDLKRLADAAHAAGATALLTTEKDRVRLGKLTAEFTESVPLKSVRLLVEIEHADQAVEWLAERLRSTAPRNF